MIQNLPAHQIFLPVHSSSSLLPSLSRLAQVALAAIVAITLFGFLPTARAAADNSGGKQTSAAYQYRDVTDLTAEQQAQIQKLAVQQAVIWGDTILGGDFEAAGDTRVDLVQAVYSGETLLGYRVTYSETAWATSNCNYDPSNKTTLSACLPGRISESMFVSPDFKEAQRDESDFAHFLN